MDIRSLNELKKVLKKGNWIGFVPRRLEIAGLPQFNNFPF